MFYGYYHKIHIRFHMTRFKLRLGLEGTVSTGFVILHSLLTLLEWHESANLSELLYNNRLLIFIFEIAYLQNCRTWSSSCCPRLDYWVIYWKTLDKWLLNTSFSFHCQCLGSLFSTKQNKWELEKLIKKLFFAGGFVKNH